jgi:ABC-type dipeptide/oligopeptide/nickel transport system permease component
LDRILDREAQDGKDRRSTMTFLLHRLLWTVPILVGVVSLVFLLVHLVPGDPVDLMLGEQAVAVDRAQLRAQLGLDRPLGEQYLTYLRHTLTGNLGESLQTHTPVTQRIARRYSATVELMIGGLFVALIVAFPLGVTAAVHHGRWPDHAASTFAVLGVAIPSFWLGPMLVLVFAIWLDWLPVDGWEGWSSLILPAVTLGVALAALLSRLLRAALVNVLRDDYIRTARAKGLQERAVLWRHALRNALIPVVTVIGLQIGVLLSGAIITESIFDWPGLGSLMLEGIRQRDYPVVQGCVLTFATTYVVVNLFTDLAYGWFDPRIRHRS